jgi:hypothetical protein
MSLQEYQDLGLDAREFNGKFYLTASVAGFIDRKFIVRPLASPQIEKIILEHSINIESLPKFPQKNPIGGFNRWEVKLNSKNNEILCDFFTGIATRQFIYGIEWQCKYYLAGEVEHLPSWHIKTVHDQDVYNQKTKPASPNIGQVLEGLTQDAKSITDYPDIDDFAKELCGNQPVSETIQTWVTCQNNKKKLLQLVRQDAYDQLIKIIKSDDQ